MSALRVGVCQIQTSVDSLESNVEKHLTHIRRAEQDGLDLLVFPELSLTGYPNNVADIERLSRDLNGTHLNRLTEAAKHVAVVVGYVEEGPAAQFYNTSLVLHGGEIVYRHRKLNLATYGALHEGKLFATGRYVETFRLKDPWRAGLLICADAWNPALAMLTALHGATVLIVPTASAYDAVSGEFSSVHGWHVVTEFYALVYGMPVIMANQVGQSQGLRFWGGSQIVDPFGTPLAAAATDEEAFLTAELSYDNVRRARLQLPTVRDSNLSLIQREVNRLQDLLGVPESVRKA